MALLLGSCRLGFMLSPDISGLLVGRPVTETALQLGSFQGGSFFWF